jgi:hypothetical protein
LWRFLDSWELLYLWIAIAWSPAFVFDRLSPRRIEKRISGMNTDSGRSVEPFADMSETS